MTPEKLLFFEKLDDKWSGLTYAQTETRITQLAFYMAELGLSAGRSCLLCAENGIDWAVADLAIMAIGCVVVPAYTTNTEDDHAWLIDHSQVKLVICCAGKVGDSLAKGSVRTRFCCKHDPDGPRQLNSKYQKIFVFIFCIIFMRMATKREN